MGYWKWEKNNPFMTRYIELKEFGRKPNRIRITNKNEEEKKEDSLANWMNMTKKVILAMKNNTKIPPKRKKLTSEQLKLIKEIKYWN